MTYQQRRRRLRVRPPGEDDNSGCQFAPTVDRYKRRCPFPSMSSNGRYVTFFSRAPRSVPHDTNQRTDVVHDTFTGATKHVSVATGGAEASGPSGAYASISGDGRVVALRQALERRAIGRHASAEPPVTSPAPRTGSTASSRVWQHVVAGSVLSWVSTGQGDSAFGVPKHHGG